MRYIKRFAELGISDVPLVGGKNASLGEMVQHLGRRGVSVPPGFATTAPAYWRFVEANGLADVMAARLADLAAGKATLAETGQAIRHAVLQGDRLTLGPNAAAFLPVTGTVAVQD